MTIKREALASFLIVILLAAVIGIAVNQSATAQDQIVGIHWEYREIAFAAPINFATPLGDGYFQNGNFVTPNNPETRVNGLFTFLGQESWELISNINNQFFIFKRPAQ